MPSGSQSDLNKWLKLKEKTNVIRGFKHIKIQHNLFTVFLTSVGVKMSIKLKKKSVQDTNKTIKRHN